MKGLGRFSGAWTKSPKTGLLSLAEQPIYFQSQHQALFLDQSVSDALGGEGWAVRRQAAFEAAHAILSALCNDLKISNPADKIALSTELFSALGYGLLHISMSAEGGSAHGETLFWGHSFSEKYGAHIRNKRVLDAYTSGFISAAASLAHPSDWGVFEAEETACFGRRDPACEFVLSRRPERARFGAELTRSFMDINNSNELNSPPAQDSHASELIQSLASDAMGTINAFGARISIIPAMYANQIVFDTMHLIEKRAPELSPVFGALVREAAQMDAFYFMGGIFISPQYRELRGALPQDPHERLNQLLEIARALGWGCITAGEFLPGQKLVLQNSSAPEAIYYSLRHGKTMRARLLFQQGLALGMMHLLSGPDLSPPVSLTPSAYNALFRDGPRFHAEETRSPLRGDEICEVVVEAIGS